MHEKYYKILAASVLKGRQSIKFVSIAVWNELLAWLPANSANRQRLFLAIAALPVMGAVAAFATTPSGPGIDVDTSKVVRHDLPLFIKEEDVVRAEPLVAEERIRRGDSVASVLNRLGVNDSDLWDLFRIDPLARKIEQLKPGKVLSAQVDSSGRLKWLRYWHSPAGEGATADVLLIERKGDTLSARNEQVAFERQVDIKAGEIRSSLYAATDEAGVPDAVANQLAEVFSAQIDFHRELKKGDKFRVVYETMRINGQMARAGRILAAEFQNDGDLHEAYWYNDHNASGYYTADGKNLRKAFLRSPLEFSRVTSGFTNARFHPILQTWRAHMGVDYGAPTGTSVRTTADGMIQFAGVQSGYGNVVIVKHHGAYSTVYAHLSGFGDRVRVGSKVSQGDVVGYVGSTGWATGPHLHYEFRINDVQQDPLAISLPSAEPLVGDAWLSFRVSAARWKERFSLANTARVARAE
jgi:murein DD-endopeptidase MepM/ murein hydrolase activator NlpD